MAQATAPDILNEAVTDVFAAISNRTPGSRDGSRIGVSSHEHYFVADGTWLSTVTKHTGDRWQRLTLGPKPHEVRIADMSPYNAKGLEIQSELLPGPYNKLGAKLGRFGLVRYYVSQLSVVRESSANVRLDEFYIGWRALGGLLRSRIDAGYGRKNWSRAVAAGVLNLAMRFGVSDAAKAAN